MLKLFRDQKGFTLVELMIVVVIVGILAAVAIPMYRGSVEKARASEAEAALGTIRSSERVYHAEHGAYYGDDDSLVTPLATGNELSLDESDLDGRYFSHECYIFDGNATATTFKVACVGSLSTATDAASVTSTIRRIDQDGTFFKN